MEKSTLKKIGFLCLIITLVSYISFYPNRYLQLQPSPLQVFTSATPA